MPISVTNLFSACDLDVAGEIRWGDRVPTTSAGVYAISVSSDPSRNGALMEHAPISAAAVGRWIERVPSFTFDGQLSPAPKRITDFLQKFWLPDESILYLGKATSLRDRLSQFFRHRLGDRKPHAGGHWLKTLSNPEQLHLFFATCTSVALAEAEEQRLLAAFVRQVSPVTRMTLHNPSMPVPFANREYPPGTRKQNLIRKDVLRDSSTNAD